jgi:hypothetical protein
MEATSGNRQARTSEDSSPIRYRNEVEPGVSSDPNALQAESLQTVTEPTSAERAEPIWVRRLKLIVFVMLCIELGLVLTVLPWHPVWLENSLLEHYPRVRSIFHMNFVRGAVSGLGLVDIWIGVWEAVHYREPKGGR